MSNSIRSLKRSLTKDKHNADDAKPITNLNKLSFADRIVPNALYIKLETGEVTITEHDKSIGATPVSFKIAPKDSNMTELIELLSGRTDINKVIMDNNKNFKILEFTEFFSKLKEANEKRLI